ncbi:MAG TPA: thiamine-phosphate kinase [Woeseiaceae bacterium]|nr:thiamine-phosphate kinase [Woeseiaceae bacterium]
MVPAMDPAIEPAIDEFELIRRYFTRAGGAGVVVGVGDDGAVLAPAPGRHQVQVIDTLVEDVHFPKALDPADIGYRAVAVNLSDIAAMGAAPRWMTLALSLPAAGERWLEAFAGGLLAAAAEFDVALVGGDTTRAPIVVVTVHVTGDVAAGAALTRGGARPGDTIYVTGSLGDAAAGLDGLARGAPVRELLWRFARPAARVRYGQALVGHASAAIDVSDGLYGDLGKLLAASGAGAEIDLERLPLSDALVANYPPDAQRHFALAGGDDYELCFTAGGAIPDPGILAVTPIGTVTATPGIVCRARGIVVPYADAGYRHFGPSR